MKGHPFAHHGFAVIELGALDLDLVKVISPEHVAGVDIGSGAVQGGAN